MTKKLKIIATILATLCMCSAWAESRNQVWTKAELEGNPIKEGWAQGLMIKCEEEPRWNMGSQARFYDTETLMLLGWKWNPYLTTYAGWRYVNEQSCSTLRGQLRNESRPTLEFTLSAPEFQTLKFDSRTRVEFRNKSSQTAYVRYRERFRVRTSWSVTDFKITPFASEELFFEDKRNQPTKDVYDRNRSQLGLTFKPMPETLPGLECNLYYMVQHDLFKHDQWTPTNVYGLELKYSF